MKPLVFIFLLSAVCSASAQKIYVSGLAFKGTVMSEISSGKDLARLMTASTINDYDKSRAARIRDGSPRQVHTDYLALDLIMRFKDRRNLLKWTEWTLGMGITRPDWYFSSSEQAFEFHNDTMSTMSLEKTRHSGIMLESKILFNSSPYRSRMMPYIGLGARIGLYQQKNNQVRFTDIYSESFSRFTVSEVKDLSTMPSSLLGVYGILGLKYNASCLFSFFGDINMGYYNRVFADRIHMDGRNFSLSLGMTYKLGNNIDPAPEEVSAEPGKDRKKMQVYW
mgnify:CR=1 FL=1